MQRVLSLTSIILPAMLAIAPLSAAAQGWPPIEKTFANGGKLRLYGWINKGVLQYDDGRESETYGLIDNDNKSTRAGLRYSQTFGDWTFENRNEIQYAPYSTGDINVLQQTPTSEDWDFTDDDIRYLDFSLSNDRYGKFYIGQGAMTTNGVPEVDYSDTDVIGYSEVEDIASAQLFRFSDPSLSIGASVSEISVGDAFSNFNGARRVRVRYDTRDFKGFSAGASFGRDLLTGDANERDQNLFDVAMFYERELEAFKIGGAVGYFWDEDNTSTWTGSAAVLHKPTGLNFTLAAGSQDKPGLTSSYWYTKAGLKRDWVAWGETRLAFDYYAGEDFTTGGSHSDTWALMVVQAITRANTELWLTYREYRYADPAAEYKDGQAAFGGVRITF